MSEHAARPTEPRLPLLTAIDPESEVGQIMGGAMAIDGQPLNIFGMLAHHPKLFKRFNLMGGASCSTKVRYPSENVRS